MAISLQHAGFRKPINDIYPDNLTNFHYKLLSPTATVPTKGTPSGAGYDTCVRKIKIFHRIHKVSSILNWLLKYLKRTMDNLSHEAD